MSLQQSTKDAINRELHQAVLGDTSATKNYLRDSRAMQPVLDRILQDGWIVEAWTDRSGGRVADWSTAAFVQLRRSYRVRVTRTPEHQALVVRRQEVAPGDDTYISIRTELSQASLSTRPSRSFSEVVDTIVEAMALAVLMPEVRKARPADREGDLT